MLLRVIRERWNEDGTPMVDPQSGAARIQLVNGGHIRVLNPKTHEVEKYVPGQAFEVPDHTAKEILFNSPQTVEPEDAHQARLAARRQHESARASELDALDARIREQSREIEQLQKLNAMIDDRERKQAAENLRVAQAAKESTGRDAQIEALLRKMEQMEAASQAKIAELEAKLTAPATSPAEPIDPPAEKSTRKKGG